MGLSLLDPLVTWAGACWILLLHVLDLFGTICYRGLTLLNLLYGPEPASCYVGLSLLDPLVTWA